MVFQHYTTDDFIARQDLLNKPFTLENVFNAIKYIDPKPYLEYEIHGGVKWWRTNIDDTERCVISNCTFSEVLFGEVGSKHDEFADINSWIYHGGLPILSNTRILREDHPELDYITCDKKASQHLYKLTYGRNNDDS